MLAIVSLFAARDGGRCIRMGKQGPTAMVEPTPKPHFQCYIMRCIASCGSQFVRLGACVASLRSFSRVCGDDEFHAGFNNKLLDVDHHQT